jgi:hypothetical protein
MSISFREKNIAVVRHAGLQPGARITVLGDTGVLAERVRLSSGTRPANGAADIARGYAGNTFVPRSPWRQAFADELAMLNFNRSSGGVEWCPSTDVAIIRIPDKLILPFSDMLEQHGVRAAADRATYQSIAKHPRWMENRAAIDQYLKLLCHERLYWIYFRIDEPDRLTLTKDEFGVDGQKLVGLHIDSWDGLPLRHRYRSRNRVCVNFGREPRYCLFFNLTLMDMFRYINLRDPEDIYEDFRGLRIAQRFMKTWPEYPVIRLQVNPGEAYILATDNLVHDASTEGNSYPDITLAYLGLFVPSGPEIVSMQGQ